jgi:hypothetical protein
MTREQKGTPDEKGAPQGAPKAEKTARGVTAIDWWGKAWFVVFAIVLVVGAGYFGYREQKTEMGIAVVACLLVMALANMGQFVSFKGLGFEAKMREVTNATNLAYATMEHIRAVAVAAARHLLALLAREGRFGSLPDIERIRQRDEILGTLKSLEVPEKQLDAAEAPFRQFFLLLHVKKVLDVVWMRPSPNPDKTIVGFASHDAAMKALAEPLPPASPGDLRTLYRTHRALDAEAEEAIKDYEHFLEKNQLRRPEQWGGAVMARERKWIERPRAKLHEFFPDDDPDSYWLLRLAIIRDDLTFELKGLGLSKDDDGAAVWRCTYFLRRLSITLGEAESIFSAEVGPHAKQGEQDAIREMRPRLQKAIATLQRHRPTFDRLRNAIGAHVRPSSSKLKGDTIPVEQRVLRNHREWEAQPIVDLTTSEETCLHEISKTAVLFAWPEATDFEGVVAKHDELKRAIFDCVPVLVKAIDALLFTHWLKHGAAQPPEDHDLGIHTGKGLVRVEVPSRKERP